jgi:ATP-dependent Clp protease ATP-binding subunit ClpC
MTSDFEPGDRGGDTGRSRLDLTRLVTADARELLGVAATLAEQRGNGNVDSEHLLWAAAALDPTRQILIRAGADPDALMRDAQEAYQPDRPDGQEPRLLPEGKHILLEAQQACRASGARRIGPEHLLLALAASPHSGAGRILASAGVTQLHLQRALAGQPRPERFAATPTLDEFGRDLTAAASAGQVDPVIGRAAEIEQTVEVLARRTKNNPVLIGEAGVGKTAIAEGIAQRIADGDVPAVLAGKRVIQLELSGVVAGTRYRGDFEQRVRRVMDEVREQADRLILFIDELHTLVGTGGGIDGGLDAADMLKPALARGELHVIGATTTAEYRRHIERDAALARRFQPVPVDEPSAAGALQILCGLQDRYEEHHQVRYTPGALQAAVRLADRYISDRYLPDKAVDLLDQAGARAAIRAGRYVTEADIAAVVSRATGIPVARLTEEEQDRLLRLEDRLHERVVGQDEAIGVVAEAIRRSRAGLGQPGRPTGSFLFLGPTGVGKTEVARALAQTLLGAPDKMIRLDMTEFAERHTASRLTGAPPGYLGYDEAGQLTEAVRRRPYSVVLLDEIEKAHPDVLGLLLQILDEGRLTDGQGATVDFSHTVLIMTSNLGSELISRRRDTLGFEASAAGAPPARHEDLRGRLMPRLRESFRPEFLNRIDEVVVFRGLDQAELALVTRLQLEQVRERLAERGVALEVTGAAVTWLARRGYEPESGARPLRRVIQREVEGPLSRRVLGGGLRPGQQVVIRRAGDRLAFSVR